MNHLYSRHVGSHGTPPNGMLSNNLVLVSLREPKLKTYKGLNMLHLVKSLVHYCRARDLVWDARKDIVFLCRHYGEDVQSIRNQLDQKAVQQNFLGTPFFSRLPTEDQRRCYQILLGKEPPPAMAITPPMLHTSHMQSHSASETLKPRINSHKSSPTLNVRISSEFLSPALPNKQKNSRQHHTGTSSQPVELAATSQTSSNPQTSARDSRSRYRPISAPTSRLGSPEGLQTIDTLKHKSMDMSQSSKQHGGLVHNSLPRIQQQHQQPQCPVSPVEMSATPAPYDFRKNYQTHRLELEGDNARPQRRGNNSSLITNNPVAFEERTVFQGPQQARIEKSGTPLPASQTGSLHLVHPEGEPAPLQQWAPNSDELTRRLHLVGAEGLYQAPLKQSSFVFELDAAPKPNDIMAELSADIDAALQIQGKGQDQPQELSSEPVLPKVQNTPALEDSPVSPPDSRFAVITSPPQHQEFNRPSNPRTQSAPLALLPASLMVGGRSSHHTHQRVPSNGAPSQTAPVQTLDTQTNASRYSHYYSPPSSTPNSNHASPQLNPARMSAYKAYHPPSMPLSPPEIQQLPIAPAERSDRASSFGALKDVDGAQHYFRTHKRDASHDSHTSTASHDSSKLAQEYQAELPSYGEGYGGRASVEK